MCFGGREECERSARRPVAQFSLWNFSSAVTTLFFAGEKNCLGMTVLPELA